MAGAQFFIKGDCGDLVPMLHEHYPDAEMEQCERFLCVTLSIQDSTEPDDLLKGLASSREIYWYHITSSIDLFKYFHWECGVQLRALYFDGKNWQVVSGLPEPWERQAFFGDYSLEQLPSWKERHGDSRNELKTPSTVSIGPGRICAKDARNALLGYFLFWD